MVEWIQSILRKTCLKTRNSVLGDEEFQIYMHAIFIIETYVDP